MSLLCEWRYATLLVGVEDVDYYTVYSAGGLLVKLSYGRSWDAEGSVWLRFFRGGAGDAETIHRWVWGADLTGDGWVGRRGGCYSSTIVQCITARL